MRIVGGINKGRNLKSLPGLNTRPTLEKIRGAIFNSLYDVSDLAVLDMFGGSGAMALEALSRGAAKAVIIENNKGAVDVIRANIELTDSGNKVALLCGDFKTKARSLCEGFDVIFLDPPYGQGLVNEAITLIYDKNLLNDDGIIVVETGGENLEYAEHRGFECIKEKSYGGTAILYYRKNKIM